MERYHTLLLRAYPRAFRERHADELLQFWSAQAEEAKYSGLAGGLRLLVHLTRDAVGGGVRMRMKGLVEIRDRGERGLNGSGRDGMTKFFMLDLKYALRSLKGSPLFSIVAVLTLALGIGATSAVFAVVETVVLRPLPLPEPDQLVQVRRTEAEGETQSSSWPDFRDYRDQAKGFLGLTAYSESQQTFEWAGGAEELRGAHVTREFFSVLGVPPLMGRSFTAEEDRLGGPKAIVLSHGLWQRSFGGEPDVVGRLVPMSGQMVPVVGVMPEGFASPYAYVQYWEPLQEDQILADVGLPVGSYTLSFLSVLGRVDPAFGLAVAEEGLRALAHSIDESVGKRPGAFTNVTLVSLQESLVGEIDSTLFFLLAAAGLVLLVACANVAGLSFGRATARERELAVRSALGAGRRRLLHQLMTESFVLSLVAGGVGVAVAAGLQKILLRSAPEGLPRLETLGLDGPTLLFAGGVTVLSGVLFGLLPALKASRADVVGGLAGGRGSGGDRRALRPQQVLVAFQVALSVVLLSAAALLTNSYARLVRVDRGFEAESVVLATIGLSSARYGTPAGIDAFYEALLGRVGALPGVASASTTYSPPLAGNGFHTSIVQEGVEEDETARKWAGSVIIRGDYFDTNGVPLLKGRNFGPGDRLGEPMVAIVNETMARMLWPGDDPIGKRFQMTDGIRGSADSFDRAFFPDGYLTVIGVAGDVRRTSLSEEPTAEYYRPHAQITWGFQYLMVRTHGDPSAIMGQLRETVWAVDATVPVRTVQTLESQVAASVAIPRFRTLLLGGFAALTSLLAMVGLYAIMALSVARRTREMGIRLALGASSRNIVKEILRRGFVLVAVGTGLGLLVALVGGGAISSMLFQVEPTDPITHGVVVALTALVALAACYLPARRAGKVDPVRSLQQE